MTFTTPLLLLALVPVAGLAVAYLVLQRRRTRYAVRFATLPMLERVAPQRPKWRRHLVAGLVLLALTAIALAAAGPQLPLRVPYERATVIVAVDTSGSMRADDVEPDRLTAAKAAAVDFVRELPERFNVGAIAFAGDARLVAPATTDRAAVERSLRSLEIGGGGTAIGEAVFASAAEVLRQAAGDDAGASPTPTPGAGAGSDPDDDGSGEGGAERVPARMVLLSDGSNSAGRQPSAAVRAAQDAGMPISTIAYGTPDGTMEQGGTRVRVPVDEATLRMLAEETGGTSYRAESGDELRQVYSDIGSSIGWRVQDVLVTVPLLLVGLAAVLVAAALSLRWFSRLV